MKKKQIILGAAAAVCAAALTVTVCCSRYRRPLVHRFRVGIAVYQADDPYLQSLTDQIMQALQSKNQNGTEILYDFFDASGSAYQQNNQLHTMMQQEYDVILWNPVTPTNVMGILEEAESRSIPVILFNREPAETDIEAQAHVWYVGTDAQEAGTIQGNMLIQAWQVGNADRNQDGVVDYLLIEGEQAHADVINRTDAFLRTASASLSLHQVQVLSANWSRTTACKELENLPEETIRQAEAVICSNDSMALGVYDFYTKQQWELPILIGINGIPEMRNAIDSGQLYGTVDLNVTAQAEQIAKLVEAIAEDNSAELEQRIFYLPQYPYTKH